jgi:hypothetical protein
MQEKEQCLCHKEELDGVFLCGDGVSLSYKSKGKCPSRGRAQIQR